MFVLYLRQDMGCMLTFDNRHVLLYPLCMQLSKSCGAFTLYCEYEHCALNQ